MSSTEVEGRYCSSTGATLAQTFGDPPIRHGSRVVVMRDGGERQDLATVHVAMDLGVFGVFDSHHGALYEVRFDDGEKLVTSQRHVRLYDSPG